MRCCSSCASGSWSGETSGSMVAITSPQRGRTSTRDDKLFLPDSRDTNTATSSGGPGSHKVRGLKTPARHPLPGAHVSCVWGGHLRLPRRPEGPLRISNSSELQSHPATAGRHPDTALLGGDLQLTHLGDHVFRGRRRAHGLVDVRDLAGLVDVESPAARHSFRVQHAVLRRRLLRRIAQ
jgi:hypothetical protein